MAREGLEVKLTAETTSNWEEQFMAHLRSESHAVAYQTARKLQKYAKIKVPQPPGVAPRTPWAKNSPSGYVRTGDLKRSIRRVKVRPGLHRIEASVVNDQGKEYARYVEYGTRYMIAQPFMAPAIRKARAEMRKTGKGLLVFRRTRKPPKPSTP